MHFTFFNTLKYYIPRVTCACLKCEENRWWCSLLLDAVLQNPVASADCMCVHMCVCYLSPCCRARCNIISRQYWAVLGPLYSHSWSPGASHSREGQSDRRTHREGRLCSSRFSTSSTSGGRARKWNRQRKENSIIINARNTSRRKLEREAARKKKECERRGKMDVIKWNTSEEAPRPHLQKSIIHQLKQSQSLILWKNHLGVKMRGVTLISHFSNYLCCIQT